MKLDTTQQSHPVTEPERRGRLASNAPLLRELAAGSLLFLVVLGVYLGNRGVIQSSDGRYTLHIALSVIHAGDLNLDEYADEIAADDYRVTEVNGHLQSVYPLGTPIFVVPFAYLAELLVDPVFDIDLYEYLSAAPPDTLVISLDLAIASFITALAVVVVYAFSRYYLPIPAAIALALVFAFGTSAWSTASRGLWQHGTSMLLLSLCLLIVAASREREWLIQFLGLVLAIAVVVRPTNAIPAGLFAIYVFARHRRYFLLYVVWALAVAVPFLFANARLYGHMVPDYYWPEGLGGNSSLVEGMAGTLFSPSRGLFVYSPVLLLSVAGVVLLLRQSRLSGIDVVIITTISLHWLLISSWSMWWGGVSYGPRLFTDMMPLFVWLLIPIFAMLFASTGRPNAALLAVTAVLVVASVAIHYRGATQPETWIWSLGADGVAENVDTATERLWDWSAPQFLSGLGSSPFQPVQ